MADALGPPQPPQIQTAYRHMLPEDTAIWTRWLQKNSHRITGVWYDVHVGQALIAPPGLHPSIQRDADAITRKRIDVVAKAPPEIWVIEVKPVGNYTALGQAQVYSRLFRLEYNAGLPVVPLVVCAEIDPDLVDDYQRLGVRFEQTGWGNLTT